MRAVLYLFFFIGLPVIVYGQTDSQGIKVNDTLRVPLKEVLISNTPMTSLKIGIKNTYSNVQHLKLSDDTKMIYMDLTNILRTNFTSVQLNEANGNSLQRDLTYRGFRASPLLGVSQGISVYQDGVRMNELFGDVMNWDLIPISAINEISILAGANAVFGLNSLGGVINLNTESVFTSSQKSISVSTGSFGVLKSSVKYAKRYGENLGIYALISHYKEKGWRDYSSSESLNSFIKGSWKSKESEFDLSINLGKTNLTGNGAVPITLLQQDRTAVFTHPDNTKNKLFLVNAIYNTQLSDAIKLSVSSNFKHRVTDTFNGDASLYTTGSDAYLHYEEEGDENGEPEEGDVVFDQRGNPIVASEEVLTAVNNMTNTLQNSYQVAFQLYIDKRIGNFENVIVFGGVYQDGEAKFKSKIELAQLTDTRGTIGSNLFDGDSFTSVDTEVKNTEFYLMETFHMSKNMNVNFTGKAVWSALELKDRIGVKLNGSHRFFEFNPSFGVVYNPSESLSLFSNISSSSRIPTPVELTCADPDDPCLLPNAFLSDPPLETVVARSFEIGTRFKMNKNWHVNAAAFLTKIKNDIYFVSSGPAKNTGYFTNIGDTQRRGAEIKINYEDKKISAFASASYMEATFEESFLVSSPFHPKSKDGTIAVSKGDHIPLLPNYIGNLGINWRLNSALELGWNLNFSGEQYLRGDEGNIDSPIASYVLNNLTGTYRFSESLLFYTKIDNIFNVTYETFGLYGEPDEVAEFEDYENPVFLTPGSPFNLSIGLQFRIL
ncbi:MAG: hypothetical protein COB98_11095 [Flavobacteriaceae bacterium]|nr:MAG: hypothetical protein COB98_11095 [Flavobacteriaceae bacterium]